jgi:hypothetical protein
MELFVQALLVVVGLINLAPVVAVTSAKRVQRMYAVDVASPDLEILLRHRAVLFGIVGAVIIASAFHEPLRWPAIMAAFISMASFVALASSIGGYSANIRRVVVVDVAALVLLSAATVAQGSA